MPIEYEHRYLVGRIPVCDAPTEITQTYIAVDRERSLVQRVRKICNEHNEPRYMKTLKIGHDPSVHEVEFPIPAAAYDELVRFFRIGTPILKLRHHVYIDGLKWDVDLFENGMIIAELEDPPETYSTEPFGKAVNISDRVEFKNFKLSLDGYPEFKKMLE